MVAPLAWCLKDSFEESSLFLSFVHSQINHSICSESVQRKRKHFHTSFYNPVAGILREGEKGNQGAQEPDAHNFPSPF